MNFIRELTLNYFCYLLNCLFVIREGHLYVKIKLKNKILPNIYILSASNRISAARNFLCERTLLLYTKVCLGSSGTENEAHY